MDSSEMKKNFFVSINRSTLENEFRSPKRIRIDNTEELLNDQNADEYCSQVLHVFDTNPSQLKINSNRQSDLTTITEQNSKRFKKDSDQPSAINQPSKKFFKSLNTIRTESRNPIILNHERALSLMNKQSSNNQYLKKTSPRKSIDEKLSKENKHIDKSHILNSCSEYTKFVSEVSETVYPSIEITNQNEYNQESKEKLSINSQSSQIQSRKRHMEKFCSRLINIKEELEKMALNKNDQKEQSPNEPKNNKQQLDFSKIVPLYRMQEKLLPNLRNLKIKSYEEQFTFLKDVNIYMNLT